MRKVKVLYFVDRMLRGGIQSLVIEWIPRFDKEKVEVDFLLLDDGITYELEEELKKMGCNVYKLKDIWLRSPLDYIKYKKAVDDFFDLHNDYKVIHLHSSSKNYYIMKSAFYHKIPVRIAHSHNINFQSKNPLKKIIGNILKKTLIKYSTDYFACSRLAGEWLFGKKIVNSNKFMVIHNAVDYEKFKYNKESRTKIRNAYNISDSTFVMGHIGRFTTQKNHSFLIDIFNEFHKLNTDSKLLLVGEGILEKKVKNKANSLGLTEQVIFAGFQNNTEDFYSAMDAFVFPSEFEGLGMVLIEAQCSGVKCYTSLGVVPVEAKATHLLEFIKLDNNEKEWAKKINVNNFNQREDVWSEINANKYDVKSIAKLLENFYINKKM